MQERGQSSQGWNNEVSGLDCEVVSIRAIGQSHWSGGIHPVKWSLVLRKPGAGLYLAGPGPRDAQLGLGSWQVRYLLGT